MRRSVSEERALDRSTFRFFLALAATDRITSKIRTIEKIAKKKRKFSFCGVAMQFDVGLKCVHLDRTFGDDSFDDPLPVVVKRFEEVMRVTDSARLLRYVRVHTHDRSLYVFSHHSETTLRTLLDKTKENFSEHFMRRVARGLFEALCTLLSVGIVHRNVCPETIVLTGENCDFVRLADWGFSYATDGGRLLSPVFVPLGRPEYTAPECFAAPQSPAVFKSDVWAVGVCLLEMVHRTNRLAPFSADTVLRLCGHAQDGRSEDARAMAARDELYALVEAGGLLDNCSRELKELIVNCLKADPCERWDCMTALRCPYLSDDAARSTGGPRQFWAKAPFSKASLLTAPSVEELYPEAARALAATRNTADLDEDFAPEPHVAASSSENNNNNDNNYNNSNNVNIVSESLSHSRKASRVSATSLNVAPDPSLDDVVSLLIDHASVRADGFEWIFPEILATPQHLFLPAALSATNLSNSAPSVQAESSSLNSAPPSATPPRSPSVGSMWMSPSASGSISSLASFRPGALSSLLASTAAPVDLRVHCIPFAEACARASLARSYLEATAPSAVHFETWRAEDPLPVSFDVRDRDVGYQRKRVATFAPLLAARDLAGVVREASIDVPPVLRMEIWAILLGLPAWQHCEQEWTRVDLTRESPSDHQIEVDVPRCNARHEAIGTQEGRRRLSRILKAWVLTNPTLEYWQGLDSLTAPFVALTFNEPEWKAFCMLQRMVQRYLSGMFLQKNTSRLQTQLIQFNQLLAYHDPQLFMHLHEQQFNPELYAIPWFLTLFTHILPLDPSTFRLWDFLLLHDSSMIQFVSLAVMRQIRNILTMDFNELVLFFSELHVKQTIDMPKVVQDALKLSRMTPVSLCLDQSVANGDPQRWWEVQQTPQELQELFAPKLSVVDLMNIIRENKRVLVVFDCRPAEDWRAGHLEGSINVVPSAIDMKAVEQLKEKKAIIVVVAERGKEAVLTNTLVRARIPRVCYVAGGVDSMLAAGIKMTK